MNPAQHILIFIVRLYRWVLSPAKTFLFGPLGRCRFTPSCSAYALDALRLHGAWAGSRLAVKRVCRCHPWGGCGDDPVPLSLDRSHRVKRATRRTVGMAVQNLKRFGSTKSPGDSSLLRASGPNPL